MKVRAKTNIKYGSGWTFAGEEIVIRDADLEMLTGLVEVAEAEKAPAKKASPEQTPEEAAEKKTEAKSRRK